MSKTYVRMLSGMAGGDFSLTPGEKTDRFPKKEAERLVAAGMAEFCKAGDETVAELRKANKELAAAGEKKDQQIQLLKDDLEKAMALAAEFEQEVDAGKVAMEELKEQLAAKDAQILELRASLLGAKEDPGSRPDDEAAA